jgi:hypothetical protein
MKADDGMLPFCRVDGAGSGGWPLLGVEGSWRGDGDALDSRELLVRDTDDEARRGGRKAGVGSGCHRAVWQAHQHRRGRSDELDAESPLTSHSLE